MKFTLVLPIARSRTEVWKAFDNPEFLKNWQPTLVKHEVIEGKQGQPGAVSRLTYLEGAREFSLMEKITFRAEPDRFDGIYENNFAEDSICNTFIASGENETIWKAEVEYRFKTLPMKIVGPLMKKNFIARTERDMARFKEFVEKG
jgi:hypothetical protein